MIALASKPVKNHIVEEILNSKHQTPNEIQKSKVKNQNDNLGCKNRKSSNAKAQMTIEIQMPRLAKPWRAG
jgi:hypothetical protein